MDRDQWRERCEREVGKPYVWGAHGPDSYDCSGFVQWALAHLNLDPPGDRTADGLHRHFSRGRSHPVEAEQARLGDLIFFGTAEAVTHVALIWGSGNMLEAGGGGRKTTSVAIARRQKAEVCLSPIAKRRDRIEILRPDGLPWIDDAIAAFGADAVGPGRYINPPPLTEWLDDGRHMRLKRPFGYVEEAGREWPVPAETVVDGASIPRVLWPLIGGPFEGPYRDASIVHDHYCALKSRPWRDTHRMFLDGMLCSGVVALKAKVMYYAVYRFGPRWTTVAPMEIDVAGFEHGVVATSVPIVTPVEAFDPDSFAADAARIEAESLDVGEIEALAEARAAQNLQH